MRVTAILPVYNAQNTLERAINSLLVQAEIDQIILVDDGSTDSSPMICQSFEKKYAHVSLLRHEGGTNRGAPASRNLGLKAAKNSWIQFMDADDELLPGKIADQLICVTGEEALVVGKFFFNEEGKTSAIHPFKDPWSGLISTRLGINVSILWSKNWIEKVGGWDETLQNMQEYFLMFEILKAGGKVVYSKSNLVKVFSQLDSITNSSKHRLEKRDNYFIFREKVKNFLLSNHEFTFRRFHHYEVCTGKMLRYHTPSFPVSHNRYYFFLYKSFRNLIP